MNPIFPSAMSIPPEKWVGWRFDPSKFELINDYLKPKTLDNDDEELNLVIGEVTLCEFEPEELLAQSKTKSVDYEAYFFCPRDFKYSNSPRSNRKTKSGLWKPTGKRVEIKDKRTKKLIGTKRTMVFYKNAHPKPLRTTWVAEEYEYTPDSNLPKKRDFVLIKLKKNPEKKTSTNESTQSTTLISNLGEPSHCMASDCENQNPNEMTATLPFEKSESTHHVTSDFENQNLSEVLVNSHFPESELGNLVACNFDTQNLNEVTAISTDEGWLMASDLENQLSFFAFDGSPPMKMSSVFENQSPSDWDELSSLIASDFENQNPNGMTANSPCESSRLAASDFEKGEWSSSIEMTSDFKNQSPCNKGELSRFVTSDFENQNPNEIMTKSFFIESESVHRMASVFKSQNREELTLMSTSDSENQISPFEFDNEWCPLPGMSSDFNNQSPYDKGMSFDFENKHLEKKNYVQAPEGKCCPIPETPLDFDFPNRSEPKMSSLEEFYWGHLMAASPKNHLAKSMLPEVNPQLMEEIEAIHELDNILNSTSAPLSFEESPSYNRFAASLSACTDMFNRPDPLA